jgi:hypothetical protein
LTASQSLRVADQPGTKNNAGEYEREEAIMTPSPTRPCREPEDVGETGEERLRRHVSAAYATATRGEDRLAGYVAALGLDECARSLAASSEPLSAIAAQAPAARVGREEGRSFEQVIRAWTLRTLCGAGIGRWVP